MLSFQRSAFTMVELIFVIIIIGILSSIAIPKLQESAVLAHDAKATSVITTVMSALATERQKRILKGDFVNPVTSLAADIALGNAFSIFNADKDGVQNEVIAIPVANCTSGQTGCWEKSGTTYTYTFADSGSVVFTLSNNKITCTSSDAICARLIR